MDTNRRRDDDAAVDSQRAANDEGMSKKDVGAAAGDIRPRSEDAAFRELAVAVVDRARELLDRLGR
ncbi:hypothetical protein [Microlunatus antarcticus]|uniref:Uncharacterized protein n=1 Tax=Microlunatus antarcticus TaxID=53388 RepID=A0A7W5JS72_9ACTN|nr:hypothetical protein [Microlunatus antarcticus]MBB3325350.1 hypothetical protein [Microlunatus antarcticus]